MVMHDCIQLASPPEAVVDALEALAINDVDVAVWAVDLEKHYQAIDACNTVEE